MQVQVLMITIQVDTPEKLPNNSINPKSGFVSFAYDPSIVEIIKRLYARAYHNDTKEWEVSYISIPGLAKDLSLIDDVEIIGMAEEVLPQATPESKGVVFKTNPYEHQVYGVMFGLEHKKFLLGDDQGLGKTKQIIDIAVALRNTGLIKRCLIICGINGNKYNWEEEVAIHSNEKSWILGTRYTKRKPIHRVLGGNKERLEDLS